jgi:L-iditol 2-dehydrogenase
VCGSEVHAFQGTHPYRKAPVILGHEVAGDVIEVGTDVTGFQPGDRVIVDPQWTCGECDYCRQNMPNLCLQKHVLGTDIWPGGFGEIIVAPEVSVFHLPDHVTYEEGCLVEPLTVAVHVVNRSNFQPGETAAVLGAGSIGGLIVGVLKSRGANPIIAADIRQHCLNSAKRLGADCGILLPCEDIVDRVMAVTGGRGVDTVYIVADDATLMNIALQISKHLARIVLVSLITEEPLRFQAFDVLSKEINIIGSLMANHSDVKQAISLVSSGEVDVNHILTHLLPIDQAQLGMELAHTKADGAVKVVLKW